MRQAQKKPDGTTAKAKPICHIHNTIMIRLYHRGDLKKGTPGYPSWGWGCPVENCLYVVRD